MEVGRKGTAELVVGEKDSAQAMGSGDLPVLATPRLLALMEAAACNSLAGTLGSGQTTVGVHLDVEHTAATPLGARVRARATLERVEGRTLHFSLSAEDEREPIGKGTHRRVIIDAARFMAKVEGKRG